MAEIEPTAHAAKTGAPLLYLEDLAIGDTFESREEKLDTDAIIDFATQFDPQPFHTDPEAARDSFFQGLAASGWHTMGTTMRLLVESVPIAGGLIGAGAQVSWPRPTRPGDVLHVRSEIVSITPSRSRPERGIVEMRSLTIGQDGEVRQVFVTQLVVFRRA
jgi:acyl dehydratase